MKQPVHNDKYTIAWFKLAEFIARGEKERALGVYRLLAHSFEDRAFAHQLAGDLFVSFGDTALAIERYCQAAQLYKEQKKKMQAAAIYEHLILLDSHTWQYSKSLIMLYIDMHIYSKVCDYMKSCIEEITQESSWDEMRIIINRLLTDDHQENLYSCYEVIIELLWAYRKSENQIQINEFISLIISSMHGRQVSHLMSYIQTIDEALYIYACTVLRSSNTLD